MLPYVAVCLHVQTKSEGMKIIIAVMIAVMIGMLAVVAETMQPIVVIVAMTVVVVVVVVVRLEMVVVAVMEPPGMGVVLVVRLLPSVWAVVAAATAWKVVLEVAMVLVGVEVSAGKRSVTPL